MTKPDDIPPEVLAVAKECRRQLCLDSECTFDAGCGCLDALTRALLEAERRGMERAAGLIDHGFDKLVGEPYRADGMPSKNDKCPHGRYMYEDCEQCCSAAIRAAAKEIEP